MGLIKWQALALAIAMATLSGCEYSPEEKVAVRANDKALNDPAMAAPEFIGMLPNGAAVSRVKLRISEMCKGCTYKEHFIYIVDGAKTQTVNWTQSEGKTQRTYTQATIQLPSAATPAEIIKLADDIKQKQAAEDRAEWERLNKTYGSKP